MWNVEYIAFEILGLIFFIVLLAIYINFKIANRYQFINKQLSYIFVNNLEYNGPYKKLIDEMKTFYKIDISVYLLSLGYNFKDIDLMTTDLYQYFKYNR